ncbi:MAG: bifunctional phosphopantothenoylcysteine decarboxylase/phosphopantothenate--cysteine ligase CoaBC [Rhizobiales bacterium]|nr:bifunctional phosphopantothenoylcysteine decarboxylase/phosphopantothenate--cysteine ligase CoaBC [Hyphomicrobiales bacterium]
MSKILLIIGGGIAAYKCLEFIRRAQESNHEVSVVLTEAAKQFVTQLSVATLAKGQVYCDLFDVKQEMDVGHIRLSRNADIVVIAPATADFMAKMAHGLANDLASAVLLANNKPVLVAPAMNPQMWANPATRRNHAQLVTDGLEFIGPMAGEMAENNEFGLGRMAEPAEILLAMQQLLDREKAPKLLAGKRVLITAGPTHEPIDPVRYLANRSSGKQGYAIAAAAAAAGAQVTLISGPVALEKPRGVTRVLVETAREMMQAVEDALPADIAIMSAAVADWRIAQVSDKKHKKDGSGTPPSYDMAENPDILQFISKHDSLRPKLVIGFAAETNDVIENATKKRLKKGCDWLLANDVSPETGVMGGDFNTIHLISENGVDHWERTNKRDVAVRLIAAIAAAV